MPYKQWLHCDLFYDREMKNLVFFFKALYGYVDLYINNHVSCIQHRGTRVSLATAVILQSLMCSIFLCCQTVEQYTWPCQSRYIFKDFLEDFLERRYLEIRYGVCDCPCHTE